MTYTIERLSDLDDLTNYLNEVNLDFGIPLSNKVSITSFAEKLLTYGNVFIVKENNKIASCIGFYSNDTVNYTAHLPILSTREWARGKGFARLLVNKMLEECEERGMKTILCDSINPHAIALYKSFGFIEYKKEGEKSFLMLNIRKKRTMNILITAIGSFSADCVINSLKSGGHKVVGCDIYPSNWHAVSKDCDKVYQAPFATKENEYIQFLLDICKEEEIDCIFPLTDLEIDVLNHHRKEFKEVGISLFIQSESCLNIARDKYAMYKLFKDDEVINLPYSVCSEELTTDFPIPAIAKPINGRSSEGLRRITRKEELTDLLGSANYIIQQNIPGSVFTVDYVRDNFDNDFAVPREELLRTKNGAGTTVRIVPDNLLMNTVSYIGKKLAIVGCVNMEFILNEGNYYLIDINPRFSAGVAFSNFIGYNMVTSHLNAFTGGHICCPIEFREQIICKRYQEELLWMK